MADAMETVTRDDAGADTTERVGPFMLTVASSEPSPEAAGRWGRRAEVLANWLVGEWRREQVQAKRIPTNSQGRSDADDAIRRCDLN